MVRVVALAVFAIACSRRDSARDDKRQAPPGASPTTWAPMQDVLDGRGQAELPRWMHTSYSSQGHKKPGMPSDERYDVDELVDDKHANEVVLAFRIPVATYPSKELIDEEAFPPTSETVRDEPLAEGGVQGRLRVTRSANNTTLVLARWRPDGEGYLTCSVKLETARAGELPAFERACRSVVIRYYRGRPGPPTITPGGLSTIGRLGWMNLDPADVTAMLQRQIGLPDAVVTYETADFEVHGIVPRHQRYWSIKRGGREILMVVPQEGGAPEGPRPASVFVRGPDVPTPDGIRVGDKLGAVLAKHPDLVCSNRDDAFLEGKFPTYVECMSLKEARPGYIVQVPKTKKLAWGEVSAKPLADLEVFALWHDFDY
jgi:hypothetical protein